MITLITGAPGTGKSAALVSLLAELSKDRAVYCSGIPDLEIPHIDLDKLASESYSESHPVRVAYASQSGNKAAVGPNFWPELVPDGSIVVIDEVQRVWRPRGPGQKVPVDIAALETHRHRGLDFYVVTQAPRLMDSNVRGLTGRHVHLRDLGLLGRWWYEWPECADNCSTAWKNAPIKKRYSLPKAIFSKYKSASVHVKPVRSVPWMVAVMALALLLVALMSWKAYSAISGKINPVSVAPVSGQAANMSSVIQGGAVAAPAVSMAYDSTAFIAPVSNKPESAPAYDSLRVVVSMPKVTGALCMGSKCKCYTQQATDAGLSDKECREWMANRPFDPYAPDGSQVSPQASNLPSANQSSSLNNMAVGEDRGANSVNPV